MSYLRRMKDPENQKRPRRSLNTIKDVCLDCNNGALTSLDAYACQLYDRYFQKFVRAGQSTAFDYHYDLLVRWLLKVSYNSARVHKSPDLDALARCTDYILHSAPRPPGLAVYVLR